MDWASSVAAVRLLGFGKYDHPSYFWDARLNVWSLPDLVLRR